MLLGTCRAETSFDPARIDGRPLLACGHQPRVGGEHRLAAVDLQVVAHLGLGADEAVVELYETTLSLVLVEGLFSKVPAQLTDVVPFVKLMRW